MWTSSLLSRITGSGLAPFLGCQGSCGIILNGPAGSVVSFNIRQGLNEVLAFIFDTDFNYVITILQLRPSLNH